MRISDWSSDVCSSDLDAALDTGAPLSSALEASVQSVRAFPLRPDYHIVWRVSAAILLTYATLTALWYLTGWQQAPGALLLGSVSIAFFGGADEAGAAIAQFARFAAMAAVAAALLCCVLLRSEEHTSALQSLMRHCYAALRSKQHT